MICILKVLIFKSSYQMKLTPSEELTWWTEKPVASNQFTWYSNTDSTLGCHNQRKINHDLDEKEITHLIHESNDAKERRWCFWWRDVTRWHISVIRSRWGFERAETEGTPFVNILSKRLQDYKNKNEIKSQKLIFITSLLKGFFFSFLCVSLYLSNF